MEDTNHTMESEKGNRLNSVLTYVSALLSVIALIVAFSGKSDSDKLQSIDEQQAALIEKLSKTDSKIEELKKRVDSQVNSIVDQVEKNLNKLSQTIAETSAQVAAHTESLQQMHKPHKAPSAAATTATPANGEVSNGSTPAAGAEGIHTIQAGDTFGKLSQRYGVSINAIQSANPNIDPRRLKIGQQVKIPAR
ncbi:MAG: hypothetical protein A2007_03595 [Verrucomicrobia bacterium GWC2_42_7]|nr:MAG: hypothetical protein A2007_03595 [Verrucomicrobia bacterium GWC2_42_7]